MSSLFSDNAKSVLDPFGVMDALEHAYPTQRIMRENMSALSRAMAPDSPFMKMQGDMVQGWLAAMQPVIALHHAFSPMRHTSDALLAMGTAMSRRAASRSQRNAAP